MKKGILGYIFLSITICSCNNVEKIEACDWKLVEGQSCCLGDFLFFETCINLTNDYFIVCQNDTLAQVIDYSRFNGDLNLVDSCGNNIIYESLCSE
jgi:hypothetical protein